MNSIRQMLALEAEAAQARHELAECDRRIEALDLQLALDGDMAAADRFSARLLELERRFDAWKLAKQIAACMRWPF